MPSRQTQARIQDRSVDLVQTETDSPVLPVAQLEKLHEFRPDLVDWVRDETSKESQYRRDETRRVNHFVFVERLLSQVFGLLIGLAGLGSAVYLGINGQPWAGSVLGGSTVVALVYAFVRGNNPIDEVQPSAAPKKK